MTLKSLLRYDYGIKVFSVTEPSEDSDDPSGALTESIMESVADWYSQNLSIETSKGKKERAIQGLHNGSAPFGMKKNDNRILIPDYIELPGLMLAFELYATGDYSDTDIARELNKRGYKTKRGRPFSKDTVRDMLQNRTYLGQVKYQKYKRNADGSRSYKSEVEWFDGQHEAVIDEDLFNLCQEVRIKRRNHRLPTPKHNTYLLRDMVYCYDCCSHPPTSKTFATYGKMRPRTQASGHQYYRCRAREQGYNCSQRHVCVERVDEQVINILTQLNPSQHWRQCIAESIDELLNEQAHQLRLDEIRSTIERMDLRWDQGFIMDKEEFIQQRQHLQETLENLTPVVNDNHGRGADILANFAIHWAKCGNDLIKQMNLLEQIVERVYIQTNRVVAVTLRSNCHIVFDQNGNANYSASPFT
ncbi:recombinase family protein [Chloroflexi bacterium TSY]|nr:recombinase family protein [Chloroflexi bacterium TSY]